MSRILSLITRRFLTGRARVQRVVGKFQSITQELEESLTMLQEERSNNLAEMQALRSEQFSIESHITQATALRDNINKLVTP